MYCSRNNDKTKVCSYSCPPPNYFQFVVIWLHRYRTADIKEPLYIKWGSISFFHLHIKWLSKHHLPTIHSFPHASSIINMSSFLICVHLWDLVLVSFFLFQRSIYIQENSKLKICHQSWHLMGQTSSFPLILFWAGSCFFKALCI